MRLPIIVSAMILSGCQQLGFQPGELHSDPAASEFYQLQAAVALNRQRLPLFELEAQDGAAITGLKSIRVYAPEDPMQVRQYQRQWHPGWGIAAQVLGAAVPLVGNWAISREHRLSTRNIVDGMGALGSAGFGALSQSGQQTADVAQSGFGALENTARAGLDTAETGMGHIAETGQVGIGAVRDTGIHGMDRLTELGTSGFEHLGDLGESGFEHLTNLGLGVIELQPLEPVVVQPPPPEVVVIEPQPPTIVPAPDPIFVPAPEVIVIEQPTGAE